MEHIPMDATEQPAVTGDGAIPYSPTDSEEESDGLTPSPAEPLSASAQEDAGASAEETGAAETADYGELAKSDLAELSRAVPSLNLRSLSELENPRRFGELREAGLSPLEAYLASSPRTALAVSQTVERTAAPSRASGTAHLRSAVPRPTPQSGVYIPPAEMAAARELFEGMSDRDLISLYRRATAN